jgi:lauroyl/myristoyl acyltransferase
MIPPLAPATGPISWRSRATALLGWTPAYRLSVAAAAALPPALSYQAARQLGRIRYRQRWQENEGRRRSMGSGLHAKEELVDDWLDQYFQLDACDNLESICCRLWPAAWNSRLVDLRGLENLDTALGHGRGAILYSGHVHGQYMFLAALGLRGYQPALVRLEMERVFGTLPRLLYLWKYEGLARKFGFDYIRMHYGNPSNPTAPKRSASSPRARDRIVEALSHNKVVVMLIDMPFTRHTVDVDFFGRAVPFPAGIAEIAAQSRAPLLDYFIRRDTRWTPQIAEIGVPAAAEDPVSTIQYCAARLEAAIRRYPPGWSGWHIL